MNSLSNHELQKKVIEATYEYIEKASDHFKVVIPKPLVRFDLKGTKAGQAITTINLKNEVRYNMDILTRNRTDFIKRTVPHEVAHVVASVVWGFGKVSRSHGHEWSQVMGVFGADDKRCHNYDMTGVPTRRRPRHTYTCGCKIHQLTDIRHKRVMYDDQTYICKLCRCELVPVAQVSVTDSDVKSTSPKVTAPVQKKIMSKVEHARLIMENNKGKSRKEIIELFISEVKMTKAGASTYYHNLKRK